MRRTRTSQLGWHPIVPKHHIQNKQNNTKLKIFDVQLNTEGRDKGKQQEQSSRNQKIAPIYYGGQNKYMKILWLRKKKWNNPPKLQDFKTQKKACCKTISMLRNLQSKSPTERKPSWDIFLEWSNSQTPYLRVPSCRVTLCRANNFRPWSFLIMKNPMVTLP